MNVIATISAVIANLADVPSNHPDVKEAADRILKHIQAEAITIKYLENRRRENG